MNDEPNHLLWGAVLLVGAGTSCALYSLVEIAVWRVAKTHDTFILFSSYVGSPPSHRGYPRGDNAKTQILAYLLFQLEYFWLSVEVLLQSATPVAPWLSNVLTNWPAFTISHHQMLIACSRAHAVFLPVSYAGFWTRRTTFLWCAGCWVLALVVTVWST
jgi:hypothetical protein